MAKKKVDLAAEATAANGDGESELITAAMLFDLCPERLKAKFKSAKTPAARADFLYELDKGPLKKARDAYKEVDNFYNKLEAWFIQELPETQATGVTGKKGRVEIKNKEIASVKDWSKFYAHLKKKGEFELLNRAVNQKAVKERWDARKEVPGVERFNKKVVSLTGVKEKKS